MQFLYLFDFFLERKQSKKKMSDQIVHTTRNARHNRSILIKLHANAIYVGHLIKLKTKKKRKKKIDEIQ